IGEALITALSEKGTPTPLAHTLLRAPASRMDILSDLEIDGLVARSALAKKYNERIDRESAHEILEKRMKESVAIPDQSSPTPKKKEERSTWEEVTRNPMARQVGNTLVRELTRGLLGVLGLRGSRRRR